MKIDESRTKINNIDDQLRDLFLERMGIVAGIADFKDKNNIPILNSSREKDIVLRLTNDLDDRTASYVKTLYNTIFDISKSYQTLVLNKKDQLKKDISQALENTANTLPQKAAVGVQGIEGSNSYIACNKLFPRADIMYFKGFEGVFSAVQSGLCEYGVLPIENSIYGSVTNVYDLMKKYKFKIVKTLKLKIEHTLMALPGVMKKDIKEVISHEQALGQCSEYLKAMGDIKTTPCANTAIAAKMIAENGRTDLAAIAPVNCAEMNGLEIIDTAIENNGNNYTRFIVISKNIEIYPGANKISLIFNVPHEPGALYGLISKFSAIGVNLTKLESRPIPGKDFEFMFYLEADANIYSEDVSNLLSSLDNITFLGSYSEV